jgi:hypothetical protein
MTKLTIRLKGGAGSGNFGHKGRPGEVGGSLPNGSSSSTQKVDSTSLMEKYFDGYATRYKPANLSKSWNGKDIFELNKMIRRYFDNSLSVIYSSTEKNFYDTVRKLLDQSNIKLSDGDWDELGQYFDAWVPDKFEA